jgi:hypothetical protein
MRILLALAAFPLLTTFAPFALYSKPAPPPQTLLSFEAVPLDQSDPARRQVGRLTFLDGWAIRSNDRRFGGISALHVEGDEVTAVSDAGSVIRFSVKGGAASILPLPEGPGSSAKKVNRDAESMAVRGGKAWIAFEGANEVWRYRRSDWSRAASAKPEGMKDWSFNSGSEAMLRLPDGRFLIISEGKEGAEGTTEAVLFQGDPAEGAKGRTVGYRAPEGYRITDAASLPDGRMLFLHRRFALTEGISAKLTLAPKLGAKPEAVISGVEIAHFQPPLAVDNMEALSVTREAGRTIVWIASDDNFNPLQRTLLLKFALAER